MQAVTVLYQDEFLIAIHKPHNVPFHTDENGEGIVQLLKQQQGTDDLFPVHRLDRMTSGLMVFAKTTITNRMLSKLLEQRQVEKYYLAISDRKPKKSQGSIKGDMEKSRRGAYRLARTTDNPALTYFFSRGFESQQNRYWAFVLKPETGKTHQLRVALKSLGSPILGDERYSGSEASRGYLHAFSMRFDLYGKRYCLVNNNFGGDEAPYEDLIKSIEGIERPEQLKWSSKAFKLAADN